MQAGCLSWTIRKVWTETDTSFSVLSVSMELGAVGCVLVLSLLRLISAQYGKFCCVLYSTAKKLHSCAREKKWRGRSWCDLPQTKLEMLLLFSTRLKSWIWMNNQNKFRQTKRIVFKTLTDNHFLQWKIKWLWKCTNIFPYFLSSCRLSLLFTLFSVQQIVKTHFYSYDCIPMKLTTPKLTLCFLLLYLLQIFK